MPCWYKAKVLPFAVALCIVYFNPSLTAAANMDSNSAMEISEIVPREATNVFFNPPGDPSDRDFSSNIIYEIDTIQDIQWVVDPSVTEEVSLFLSVGINTSYAPTPQAVKKNPSGSSFEWTVVNAFGAISQMFQMSIRIESSGAILFMSRVFNISIPNTGSTEINNNNNGNDNTPTFHEGSTSSATSTVFTSVIELSIPAARSSTSTTEAISTTPSTSSTPKPAPPSSTKTPETKIPSTTASPTTSSLSDPALTTSTTHIPRKSTISSTKSTSSASLSDFSIPPATTFISQTSTSVTPSATALASDSANDANADGQKKAEIALGSVLGIVLFSIASYYLFSYIRTRQPHSGPGSFLILFGGKSPVESEKSLAELKEIQIVQELDGVPTPRFELYGGPREPVELDDAYRPRSVVSKVWDGITRTANWSWRSSSSR